ncbi:MAG: PhoH family protein [Proteobacteria bacterium]|nr:PhoH family protein [Pseudomonadota bacterium]
MEKVFVLDTNVLLADPQSLFMFNAHDVVIPISVIEELDNFKKDLSLRGRNAREVSRILDYMRLKGDFTQGIPLQTGVSENQRAAQKRNPLGKLFIYLDPGEKPAVLKESADHDILAVALSVQKRCTDKQVIFITKDTNLRIKGQIFGVESQDFYATKVIHDDEAYTGIRTIHVSAEDYTSLRDDGTLSILSATFYPNEYICILSHDASCQVIVTVAHDTHTLHLLPPLPAEIWGIGARNLEQRCALSALLDERIRLVTLSGMAGTGKTLLAMAAGLYKTTDHDAYQKLLVSRPIFPIGKDIGYLPGDIEQKLNPWMQPIFDSLDFLLNGGVSGHMTQSRHTGPHWRELFHQDMISVEPLTYIRGRSLAHHYFIVDEAQNLTPHEIKSILTRVGEGTKIVLTGDPQQIDLPYIDSLSNGLVHAIEKFKHHPIATHITLQKGERSELAQLSAELL